MDDKTPTPPHAPDKAEKLSSPEADARQTDEARNEAIDAAAPEIEPRAPDVEDLENGDEEQPVSSPPPPREEPEYDIVIEGFSHLYGGFEAVRDLSVSIPRGTITGFIGPNGAGKTTTIHLLATLLRPTRGDAWIAGESCTKRRARVRRLIGYMPDSFGVYEGLSAREYLLFFAETYKLPSRRIPKIIDEIVELLNLEGKLKTPVDGLSRGQLQRLSLARALLHDPRVLILDEPASGLDPIARLEFLYILRELRRLGKTILLSSHILTEVSEVCDSLMIMSEGRLVTHGSMAEICEGIRPHFTVEAQLVDADVKRAESLLRSWGVSSIRAMGDAESSRVLEFDFVGDEQGLAEIHRRLIQEGVPLLYFQPVKVTLEQAFAKLTGAFDKKTEETPAAPEQTTNEDASTPSPADYSI